jgi:hypothetical protein
MNRLVSRYAGRFDQSGRNLQPAEGVDRDPGDGVLSFRHPTLPSRLTEISFCASTANSIGSC